MNKRGEFGVGEVMWLVVIALVGLTLFLTIAQTVGTSTDVMAFYNTTITAPASGSDHVFTAYRSIEDVIITNATGGEVIPATNYTITNNGLNNGNLVVLMTIENTAYAGTTWNVSSDTAQRTDYIDSSGARAIANLIPLLFALAIAVIMLLPTLKSKIIDNLK